MRRDDEGRCGPAATRVHLKYRLMARRHLRPRQFPFAQRWHFYPPQVWRTTRLSATEVPNPGVKRATSEEFMKNSSYFALLFPFDNSGIPHEAGTFSNFHLFPNEGICLCSHLLFRVPHPPHHHHLFLSTTLPRYYPPFCLPPQTGGPSDWLLIYKCLCVLKSGTKGVGL